MEIEIINYIKEARKHGLGEQEIKQNLLNVGWEAQGVEDSFGYVKLSDTKPVIENLPFVKNMPQSVQAKVDSEFSVGQNITPLNPKESTEPAFITSSQPPDQKLFPNVSNQTPETSLSDEQFLNSNAVEAQTSANPKPKNKILIIIGAIILVLACLGIGGYFAYGYFYPSPSKIWNNYLNTQKSKISSTSFNITYSDPGIADSSGKPQNFSFSLKGTAYSDVSNASSTVLSSAFTAGYLLPGLSGSRDFKLIYLDNNLYLDLSSLVELNALVGQPLSWVKLSMDDVKKLASSTPQTSQVITDQQKLQQKLTADLANMLKNKPIITASKLIGSETVSGQSTYHLQNQIDKQALKDMANAILQDSFDLQPAASSSRLNLATAKQALNVGFDKLQLSPFETWIGKKDSQLYKFSIDIKFPGLDSFANDSLGGLNPLANAQAKSRDAKRVADMRQLASGLELYFNDHNGYPAGQNGSPTGLTPAYIGSLPAVPMPSDGDCNDYYNSYWYTPLGTPKTNNGLIVYPSYQYTFCLGVDTAGYKAGIAKLSPSGIQSGIACTDKPENCHKQIDVEQTTTNAKPASLADLSLQITYADYEKKQTVTEPANALNLLQLITGALNPLSASSSPTGTLPVLK